MYFLHPRITFSFSSGNTSKLSWRVRTFCSHVPASSSPARVQVFTFNPNQFKTFLPASDVDCLGELVEEAIRKHPCNPREITAQRPGDDRAPVLCPSGEAVPEEIIKRHEKNRAFLAAKEAGQQIKEARGTPGAATPAAEETPKSTTAAPSTVVRTKPPTAPTTPVTVSKPITGPPASNSINAGDKKYTCPVCEKGFRLAMALEHHMATRHAASASEITTAMGASKSGASASVSGGDKKKEKVSATPSSASVPSAASESSTKSTTIGATTSSLASNVVELSADKLLEAAFVQELLHMWDTVGMQRLPQTFQTWKLLDQETIMKHASALKAQVVAEKEQEKRQNSTTATTSGIMVDYTPSNLAVNTGEPAMQFNPFEVLQAATMSKQTLGGDGPRPDDTFNPFASLVGLTAPSGDDLSGGGGGNVFDAAFDQSTSSKVGGGESLSMATLEMLPTEEKRHACNVCGKAFKTQDGLLGHYEAKHPGQKVSNTTITTSEKHTIGVSLENIPAYVPTPVDLSKVPGQGTSEADARAVMIAEDIRNNIPSLENDLLIHARAHGNITLSGTVVDVTSGFVFSTYVTQFGLIVDAGDSSPDALQTVTVRVYGEQNAQLVRRWLQDGTVVLVYGMLNMNPQAEGVSGKYYNNPYVRINEQVGAVMPLWHSN